MEGRVAPKRRKTKEGKWKTRNERKEEKEEKSRIGEKNVKEERDG